MMRLLRLAGGMVLGPALLVAAAVAQTPPKPVRVQYIQFSEYFDDDAPLPQPADFDREYARVMAAAPPPGVTRVQLASLQEKELAAIRADRVGARFKDMARNAVFGLLNAAVGAVASPVAGRIVGQALDATSSKLDAAARQHEYAAAEQRSTARQSRQAEQVALQSLRHAAIVKRVSIWDSWVRIDNLREHTAVVYKPDIHRYLLIDEAHKLYRVIDGAPPPPVEAPQATCSMQFHATPLGPATVGGAPAHGYRTTSAMQLPGMAMTHHGSIYFWDTPVPASVLTMATGYRPCAATTPVGRALPTDRLVLYRSIGGGKLTLPDSQQRPQPTLQVPRIELVNMRGHLRALTDTDRALFEPPAGYRQVVGQGDTGAAGGG